MIFTNSFDDIVRKKTFGACIMFSVFPAYILFLNKVWLWDLPLIAILILVLLYTYLKMPLKYEVGQNNVLICRRIRNIVINFQEIERVDRIHHDLLKNSTSGGAFGYNGKFNTDLGKITFYATRRDKLIMLTKKDKSKIILTPDQEDEFIKDLEKCINSQH